MALTHQRAIHVRLEDYAAGQGNAREIVTVQTVAATQRPTVISISFQGVGYATPLGGPATGITGQARSIVSRTRTCTLALNAMMNGSTIQLTVPPMAQVFLPNNLDCSAATVTPNGTFPLPTGAPTASSTQNLSFDLVLET